MAELTKDEIRAELEKLGAPQPPDWAKRDELVEALNSAQFAAEWDILGEQVWYCLTAANAEHLTARERRTARLFKAVAPFDPRMYTEGDQVIGHIVSACEDGTVTVDLAVFPRVTLERVPEGNEPGTYRKRG